MDSRVDWTSVLSLITHYVCSNSTVILGSMHYQPFIHGRFCAIITKFNAGSPLGVTTSLFDKKVCMSVFVPTSTSSSSSSFLFFDRASKQLLLYSKIQYFLHNFQLISCAMSAGKWLRFLARMEARPISSSSSDDFVESGVVKSGFFLPG